MVKGTGGFLLKAAGAAAAAAGAAAVYRAGQTEARIDARIDPILDGDATRPEAAGALPPAGGTQAGPQTSGGDPGMTTASVVAGGAVPAAASGVVLWPGGDGIGAPLVPVMDGDYPAHPVLHDGGTPAAAYAQSRAGRRYAKSGNILGATLGILTALALVLGGVAAVRNDEKTASLSSASTDDATGGGGGSTDFDTSGKSGSSSAGGSTASSSGTGSSGASSNTGSGDSGGGGGDGSGGGGGGSGGGGGGTIKRPPEGEWAATGQGTEVVSTGNIRTEWSDMSLKVVYDGDCWISTWKAHSKRWADVRFCPTSDGGLIQTGSETFNIVSFLGASVNNKTTATCDPAKVVLSANPEPGQELAPGTCTNIQQDCPNGFGASCRKSPLVPGGSTDDSTVTILGRETVAGQEAWHVQTTQILVPEGGNASAPGSVSSYAPHNVEHYWFRVTDGLPLRMVRVTNALTVPLVGPRTTFHEEGSMTIVL
ncbi:MAG: hypothetical protein IT198_08080 [Acidimicrobiia bacterium]|nr:hypothetical protein [Acidimicrobiia bacterium]